MWSVHYIVYPKKYAHGFALLCFVVVINWLIFPYPSGLLHRHCGNLTIAPVPAKQPWWIWINTSCEFIMNDCITTKKQSTTKPCAYFLGYTVRYPLEMHLTTKSREISFIYIFFYLPNRFEISHRTRQHHYLALWNFETIGQRQRMLWPNKISWDLSLRQVSDRYPVFQKIAFYRSKTYAFFKPQFPKCMCTTIDINHKPSPLSRYR